MFILIFERYHQNAATVKIWALTEYFFGSYSEKTKNKGISADSRQKTKETVKITIEISL